MDCIKIGEKFVFLIASVLLHWIDRTSGGVAQVRRAIVNLRSCYAEARRKVINSREPVHRLKSPRVTGIFLFFFPPFLFRLSFSLSSVLTHLTFDNNGSEAG